MIFRGGALIAVALATAGCAGQAPGDPRFAGTNPALGDFQVPVASMLARKYATVIRQQYDFSCGSAALATLLHYHYDVPSTETDVFTGMWRQGDRPRIRQVGFSLLDMKRYLAEIGLSADGYRVTLDAIAGRGLPGIALLTVKGYRHFVVVKGVSSTQVLIGDPSRGLMTVPRAEFQSIWNGVFFVLNSQAAIGQTNFNGSAQWRTIGRAPVGDPFVDPLSTQALGLSAPFYRDF